MTQFSDAARRQGNMTHTENGAVALRSTNNALVDLFATAGALRSKSEAEVSALFQSAFAEDKLLATKIAFYTRNIRGGLGERNTFRYMLKSLALSNPEIVIKNIDLIPVFGRYDDLYTLVDTKAEDAMWALVKETLMNDIAKAKTGAPISLCAKWLKSVNTSSHKSNALGKKTARAMGMSDRIYRKTLSALRDYLNVLETKMSAKEWEEVEYSAVPSRAMKNYRDAFKKHDEARFSKFIEKVASGEEKINASTLYPYDILLAGHLNDRGYKGFYINNDPVLEAQWKALPNYIDGENNVIVMADTSASMYGLPMATSVGLAVYFAERNKGAYKDLFMTFSSHPSFVTLKGETLKEKLTHVPAICENTNVEAAFELILDVALKNNVPAEEMPKSLVIISDMQFDSCVHDNQNTTRWGTHALSETLFENLKRRFADNGYAMPTVIFWQVAERQSSFQVEARDENVILASGQSTATFKAILGNIGKTPYDFMVDCLNDPIYDLVKI